MLELPVETRRALAEAIVLKHVEISKSDSQPEIHWESLEREIAPLLPSHGSLALFNMAANYLDGLPSFEADGKLVHWHPDVVVHSGGVSLWGFRPTEAERTPRCNC